jgi:enoyl-CoA hydratase/carnithine racemase
LIFTGDTYDAVSAHSMGLVSQMVRPDQLVCNPARTLRLAKRLLREGQQQRLADVMELSAAFQALAHETGDHREAIDAFLQKRAPQFRGD